MPRMKMALGLAPAPLNTTTAPCGVRWLSVTCTSSSGAGAAGVASVGLVAAACFASLGFPSAGLASVALAGALSFLAVSLASGFLGSASFLVVSALVASAFAVLVSA